MRINIRLKGIQDIDLLALRANPTFHFERAMKVALIQHVRGEVNPIAPPLPYKDEIPDIAHIYFTLNDEKEEDVINWYKSIRPGWKSTALKAILRSALTRAYVDILSEEDIEPVKKVPVAKKKEHIEKKEDAPKRPASEKREKVKQKEEPLPEKEKDEFSLDDFVEVY